MRLLAGFQQNNFKKIRKKGRFRLKKRPKNTKTL